MRGTRVSLGLTLEEAADRCSVHARHLQKIEAGAVSPGVTTLVKIAEGFEVDPSSLPSRRTTARPTATAST
ncbi:MAG: helix-turn-helix transcriptional regulator [Polyangiales bacterium]